MKMQRHIDNNGRTILSLFGVRDVEASPSSSYSQNRDHTNHQQHTNPPVNVSPPRLRSSADIYPSTDSGSASMIPTPWFSAGAPFARLYLPVQLEPRSEILSSSSARALGFARQTRSNPACELFGSPPSVPAHVTCGSRSVYLLQPIRQPHPPPVDPLPVNFGRLRAKSRLLSNNAPTLLPSSPPKSLTSIHTTTSKVYQPTYMLQSFQARRNQVRNSNNGGGYQGDITSNMYRSQITGLPDNLNAALWIFSIPVGVTPSSIFDRITCGAVSALNLKGPDSKHDMAAADLIFKTPEGAADFLAEINEGIFFEGRQLRGIYNTRGQERDLKPHTRVIRIDGPSDIMNYEYWLDYFSEVCVYSLERALEGKEYLGRKAMEFRFVRIVAQAQACLEAIQSDPTLRGTVSVWYGPDPCE